MKIKELKKGDRIEYFLFKNITFEGTDEHHVIMKDSHGNIKKVYKWLFEKYGKKVSTKMSFCEDG